MRIDITELLFPRRCPVCHDVVEDRKERVCRICRCALPFIQDPYCMKCGKPLLDEEEEYCRDCISKVHFYKKGRAPFRYDSIMRQSIARFKYNNRREYADFYAEEIFRICKKEIALWNCEVLIPIPLHPSRRRKRGYNQAQLVARKLSLLTGIPTDDALLVRTRRTHAQKELDDKERQTNLKNAFSLRKSTIPYKKIILVDDIYTTGSTIDEAARILLAGGAQTVHFLCICVGNGD